MEEIVSAELRLIQADVSVLNTQVRSEHDLLLAYFLGSDYEKPLSNEQPKSYRILLR